MQAAIRAVAVNLIVSAHLLEKQSRAKPVPVRYVLFDALLAEKNSKKRDQALHATALLQYAPANN
jgi:hypothetical protein